MLLFKPYVLGTFYAGSDTDIPLIFLVYFTRKNVRCSTNRIKFGARLWSKAWSDPICSTTFAKLRSTFLLRRHLQSWLHNFQFCNNLLDNKIGWLPIPSKIHDNVSIAKKYKLSKIVAHVGKSILNTMTEYKNSIKIAAPLNWILGKRQSRKQILVRSTNICSCRYWADTKKHIFGHWRNLVIFNSSLIIQTQT